MIRIRYNSYKGHPLATFVSKLISIISLPLLLLSVCFFFISLDCHPIDIAGAIISAIVFVFTILLLVNHDGIIDFLFFKSNKQIRSNTKSTSSPSSVPQENCDDKKRYAQMRVDAFYAEIFAGQVSPYTGLPVKSEKDYFEYLFAKKKAESSANHEVTEQYSSSEHSFDELIRDQKLDQAKINGMTKEAYAQYRVDEACAELFKGKLNPYTHTPITCEADFREYQRLHNS